MKFTTLIAGAALAALVSVVPPASAAVKVVTTTEDLAALAREVGGDKVTVEALARATRTRTSSRRSRASS